MSIESNITLKSGTASETLVLSADQAVQLRAALTDAAPTTPRRPGISTATLVLSAVQALLLTIGFAALAAYMGWIGLYHGTDAGLRVGGYAVQLWGAHGAGVFRVTGQSARGFLTFAGLLR